MASEGLQFFVKGENEDYFAEDLLLWPTHSVEQMRKAAEESYRLLMDAALHVAANRRWREVGIPDNAIPLVEWSLRHERERHLMGRFDFSGGIERDSIKLLEYNADTFSLLPETAWVQEHIIRQTGGGIRPAFNQAEQRLVAQFKKILAANPNRFPSLLLSWMGYEEDLLNVEVIARAARQAGFKEVQLLLMEKVVFSPEEGIFVDLGREQYRQYDFWYKLAPWDFIAYDEPELMDILTELCLNDRAVVLNPAYTMLLQSKALLKVAFELNPGHPLLLKTTDRAADFPDKCYVEKPIFGRMGDNIKYFEGDARPAEANEGDYGHLPKIYQELAELESDPDGNFYQPSVYTVGAESAAICLRRQDSVIVDDDAEYVVSGVM